MKWCERDERQCDAVLCASGCAKLTMPNRCDIRGCCAEAKYHPRFLYYPDNGEGHNARPAPITISAKVCDACRAAFVAMGNAKALKAFSVDKFDNLATNLLLADGRERPNLNLTKIVFAPIDLVNFGKSDDEGVLKEAREKSAIIKP